MIWRRATLRNSVDGLPAGLSFPDQGELSGSGVSPKITSPQTSRHALFGPPPLQAVKHRAWACRCARGAGTTDFCAAACREVDAPACAVSADSEQKHPSRATSAMMSHLFIVASDYRALIFDIGQPPAEVIDRAQ
jgi:hypothetical protein